MDPNIIFTITISQVEVTSDFAAFEIVLLSEEEDAFFKYQEGD